MTSAFPPTREPEESTIGLALKAVLLELGSSFQFEPNGWTASSDLNEIHQAPAACGKSNELAPVVQQEILRKVTQITSRGQRNGSIESASLPRVGLASIFGELRWPHEPQSRSLFVLPPRQLSFAKEDFFPRPAEQHQSGDGEEKKLFRTIESFIQKALSTSRPQLEGVFSVLERFSPAIAAAGSMPQESLFDRCRMRAAFAACLATQYLDDQIIDRGRFRLVGISLGQIQKFLIRNVSTVDSDTFDSVEKGMSKQLRAKSFYVGLLSWLSGKRILDALGLPRTCQLFDAGGRTVLLVPDTSRSTERLREVVKWVETWFRTHLAGTIRCDITIGDALEEDRFYATYFQKTFREFENQLVNARLRQPFPELVEMAHWGASGWVDERETLPVDTNEFETQLRRLGDRLVKCNYLILRHQEPEDDTNGLNVLGYSIGLSQTLSSENGTYALNYHPQDPPSLPVYLWPQYVPTASSQQVQYLDRIQVGGEEDGETVRAKAGELLTFAELAALSTDEQGRFIAHQMLGAVKADVDHLGTLLSYGLEGSATLPRISGLARSLNLFFKGFLNHQLSQQYPKLYTVFSGGDDLFLIGPWYDLVRFLGDFQAWFRSATANSPNVTFSAGLVFAHHKVPIRPLAQRADEAIDHAKEAGRNRVCVGSTVVTWQQYDRGFQLHRVFRSLWAQTGPAPLNRSLLYRLLQYAEMAIRSTSNSQPHSADLKWRAQMSYDLKRNLPSVERYSNPDALIELHKLLTEIRTLDDARVLSLAATITLYTLRGESA